MNNGRLGGGPGGHLGGGPGGCLGGGPGGRSYTNKGIFLVRSPNDRYRINCAMN